MGDPKSGLREEVTISVERMLRFCYLAQMQFEHAVGDTKALPLHLTRFGTLVFETSSFLHSLFDNRSDSINLVRVWRAFDHPFGDELKGCVTRLDPFKQELKLVRNRLGFHGSVSRSHERAGLGIFDVDSGRARDFACLLRDMQQLFLRMIAWYMKGMDCSMRPGEMWNEFINELQGSAPLQGSASSSPLPLCPTSRRIGRLARVRSPPPLTLRVRRTGESAREMAGCNSRCVAGISTVRGARRRQRGRRRAIGAGKT